MEMVETLIWAFHLLAALAIIGLVLMQRGKGADMGSGFGAGASSTVFGSTGAGNFLTRMTTGIAIAFFLTSFGLAFYAKDRSDAARDLGIPVVVEQGGLSTSDASATSEVPAFDAGPADPGSEIPDS